MTAAQLLPSTTLDEIRGVVLRLLGYDPLTRNALLSDLPADLRGLLPGGMAAPAVGLMLDLAALNDIERLTDGSVPMRRFLDRAVALTGGVQDADVFRRALSAVETRTTGAPLRSAAHVTQEAIIARDDMVPFGFMTGGVTAARSVAKLMVPRHQDGVPVVVNGQPVVHLGTGWLVAESLLMTNLHVVNARNQGDAPASESDLRHQAGAMTVLFDYDSDAVPGSEVEVEAQELVAWDDTLDYAVIRLEPIGRPPLPLAPSAVAGVQPGSALAVNVIQHPDGRAKRFAIRNNLVTAATPTELQYFTDTLGGSSGSPVLDDRWRVVALHCGSAFVEGVEYQGKRVAYVNAGTQISAILQHLRETRSGQLPELRI